MKLIHPGQAVPVAALALAVVGGCIPVLSAADDRQPNVIMILADDLGTVDLHCCGAPDLVTPELDRLAERGVRLSQFYAAAPVCSPSRAAFITGLFPQRAGVPGNVSSEEGKAGMPPATVTAAEVFGASGYVTGHVGKWHLGYTPETMPNGQGFVESFGHMGGCIDNFSHFFYWQGPNRHDLWHNGQEVFQDGRYFPELMSAAAVKFIETNRERPFLLYWALNTPHYPLQGTDRWRRHYRHLPSPRNMYAAFVSTTDEIIGQVLRRVEELGLTDNTIVVFQSDHGHSTEERTFGGGGSAGPYRGAKFSLFEGGIRVPAIISWPGRLPQNEVRHQMATGCDWLPTLTSLCHVDTQKYRFDGKDISAVLQSSTAPSPHVVFHWQSGGSRNRPQWAVRKGDWKLIGYPNDTSNKAELTGDDDRFLVNLGDSVHELENLAADHPEIVKELEQLHDEWIRDVSR
ncbi:MAG: sulfatase-like hydrolase/transferase [Planctomycetaceae bacterium]|nr:sulfatase-like hydrolase/transferase [Planctomycetaceae bacterium]